MGKRPIRSLSNDTQRGAVLPVPATYRTSKTRGDRPGSFLNRVIGEVRVT